MIRSLLFCITFQVWGSILCHGQEFGDAKLYLFAKYLDELRSEDPATRTAAIGALSQLAPAGLVALRPGCSREYCECAKPLLPNMVELLKHDDKRVAALASILIANLGTNGCCAIPALRDFALKHNAPMEVGHHPVLALLCVTPETQSVLLGLDVHQVFGFRRYDELFSAIRADQLDTNARDMLVATSVGVEAALFAEFFMVTGHTKSEVPVLIDFAQNDKRIVIRLFSLGVLSCFKQDAKKALPALRSLLEDPNQTIRMYAAGAIIRIEQDSREIESLANKVGRTEDVRNEFVKDANDFLEMTQKEREFWRTSFDGDSDFELQSTAQTLKYGRGYRQRDTLRRLVAVGPPAAKLAPEVRELLDDSDEETRSLAAKAMARIQARE